ncbi:MAG: phosphatase PAP2 family protein [Abitibacteriaceae bacterium]|nr:phosphatase PAP2 family protein [Abditibacteriaceae bacterium]MBV9864304.1 phosphatase PAP2 family protein [Abditibacteriaceae bacterium]
MLRFSKIGFVLLTSTITLGSVLPSTPAQADPNESSWHRASRFLSGPATFGLVAGSVVLPLLEDGKEGKDHALRTSDSIITSSVITEVLKNVVREKRPNSNNRTSFPSGHATAAFAAASMASHWHPRQAPFWYLGASLIAASRVELRAHHVHDVIAGAAVGYATTRWELKRPRGLLLAPFISRDSSRRTDRGTTGFQIAGTF